MSAYIVVLLVLLVLLLFRHVNFIRYYSEMKSFEKNAVLVQAELVDVQNYEKNDRTRYTYHEPAAVEDLTLAFELNGEEYLKTYERVYINSTEANTDYHSHIDVYVLKDASDVQTAAVIEACRKDAYYTFGALPAVIVLLWIIVIFWLEKSIFSEKKGNQKGK